MAFEKFQKYHKRILIVLAAFIILPMGVGGFFMRAFEPKPPHVGKIDGKKISPRDFWPVHDRWVRVVGWFPKTGEEASADDIWFVHCVLAEARKVGIEASQSEVQQFTEMRLRQAGLPADEEGVQRLLKSLTLTRDQFVETIGQVVIYSKLAGMPYGEGFMGGYLGQTSFPTSEEARKLYEDYNRKARVDYVFLTVGRLLSTVPKTLDDKAVVAYHKEHADSDWLRIPEKIGFEYIGAEFVDYEKVITPPSEAAALDYYERHKDAFEDEPASKPAAASQPVKPGASAEEAAASQPASRPSKKVLAEVVKQLLRRSATRELRNLMNLANSEILKDAPEKANLKAIAERFGLHYENTKDITRAEVSSLGGIAAPVPVRGPNAQPPQFEQIAFDLREGQFRRVSNEAGIFIMRVTKKSPAHSPALDEGDTRGKVVARLRIARALAMAGKEAERMRALWDENESKLDEAVGKHKELKRESQSVVKSGALPFAAEAFEAKPAATQVTEVDDGVYVWQLKSFEEPPWEEFDKNKRFYRQMALYKDFNLKGQLWRKEILKRRTQDNMEAYREWVRLSQKARQGSKGTPERDTDEGSDEESDT